MSTRLVMTLGTFDLPHPGHVFLLDQCRAIAGEGGLVYATVNPSSFVKQFKGAAPVMTEDERIAVLSHFRSVDRVSVNKHGKDGGKTISGLVQDAMSAARTSSYDTPELDKFLVIGTDWAPPRDYHGQLGITQKWLDDAGITLLYVPRIDGFSSTDLKERIRNA